MSFEATKKNMSLLISEESWLTRNTTKRQSQNLMIWLEIFIIEVSSLKFLICKSWD